MTLKQLTVEVPEQVLLAEKMTEHAFAQEMRMLSAVKLYELGRLSSGRAADLAGVPRRVLAFSRTVPSLSIGCPA